MKSLGLKAFWPKTNVQVLGGLLDGTVQCIHVCGEDIEISESFIYIGSVVHNDGWLSQEVVWQIGLAHFEVIINLK